MDRYELAWAAGFFDGEGWAGRTAHRGRARREPHARINQAGADGIPEVLTRFRAALGGIGRVGGPVVKVGRRDLYRWEISSDRDARELYTLLQPWVGDVKMRQLAVAAALPVEPATRPDEDRVWWAWAAGLWDGEGCAALLKHRTHEGHLTPELSVTQSSRDGSPGVLTRFGSIVGAGSISGPYPQTETKMDVYRWRASALADARRVLDGLLPYIGTVKRMQARRLIDTLAAQPALPRGNPAWGNNKTHCVNGHEYATARIRPFRPRKGGSEPRPSSQCLACVRDSARRKRGE